jgi:chromate transporter
MSAGSSTARGALVVQFVVFLAAFHANGDSLAAGSLGAAIVLWVTFVPCFLWIFLGAPCVERLRGRPALDAMMTAITAAVVGVILNLALWLALRVLFREVAVQRFGPLVLNVPRSLDWLAFLAAACAFVGIARWKWNLIAVVGIFALLGLAARLVAVK